SISKNVRHQLVALNRQPIHRGRKRRPWTKLLRNPQSEIHNPQCERPSTFDLFKATWNLKVANS
ncbi:MAG TPA: hypothetical protein VGQ81_07005, partial [Acidobacteriota bacterium]|nr:hypothetical protein [Acidobacteriota bacterium]